MAKSPQPAFQPAPRPQPRVSPEQTKELAAATRDLGFGRTTTAPEAAGAAPVVAEPVPAPVETPKPALAEPKARPAPRAASARAPAKAVDPDPAPRRGPALKFDVPDELWTALRRVALDRRVTVKYLVLEALAEKGYDVDLAAVPEDGRRLR
ncbi:MAG: hypothetical protein JO303_04745 [Caulobacteraceae bacterium]|nr:hypothetical protein [Caulobacteraceae bacterium]